MEYIRARDIARTYVRAGWPVPEQLGKSIKEHAAKLRGHRDH